jgi:hypothetical protein
MLRRAAWFYAAWSIKYDIPVRWLSARRLRTLGEIPGKGRGGFTSHAEITKAFGKTNHTDPGPGFITPSGGKPKHVPRGVLLYWTRRYRKQMLAAKAKTRPTPPTTDAQTATRPANQERRKT